MYAYQSTFELAVINGKHRKLGNFDHKMSLCACVAACNELPKLSKQLKMTSISLRRSYRRLFGWWPRFAALNRVNNASSLIIMWARCRPDAMTGKMCYLLTFKLMRDLRIPTYSNRYAKHSRAVANINNNTTISVEPLHESQNDNNGSGESAMDEPRIMNAPGQYLFVNTQVHSNGKELSYFIVNGTIWSYSDCKCTNLVNLWRYQHISCDTWGVCYMCKFPTLCRGSVIVLRHGYKTATEQKQPCTPLNERFIIAILTRYYWVSYFIRLFAALKLIQWAPRENVPFRIERASLAFAKYISAMFSPYVRPVWGE